MTYEEYADVIKGSCLCGAVSSRAVGLTAPVEVCHCTQCRKWTGHFFANVEVPRSSLAIFGEQYIAWYKSSPKVRRGFCSTCGSTLFFDPLDHVKHEWVGIAMGALDTNIKSRVALHILRRRRAVTTLLPKESRSVEHE
ncbi:GFA family protein [Pseudoxanthomonas japonensis]|uniref:GFA family protein n=1 Tax=Pseudoxanthomonas japonensis TaxID=69284 RepID=UPI003D2F7A00